MERSAFLCELFYFKEQISRQETRRIKPMRRRMERVEVSTVTKNGSPVLWCPLVMRGWPALFCRHRPSLALSQKTPPHSLAGQNSGVAHANHLTPAPLPTTPTSVQPCSYHIGAAKLCSLIVFFFNCRLSLDSRSHDQLFLPHFAFFYAWLSVDAFACLIIFLLVFSFLKRAGVVLPTIDELLFYFLF